MSIPVRSRGFSQNHCGIEFIQHIFKRPREQKGNLETRIESSESLFSDKFKQKLYHMKLDRMAEMDFVCLSRLAEMNFACLSRLSEMNFVCLRKQNFCIHKLLDQWDGWMAGCLNPIPGYFVLFHKIIFILPGTAEFARISNFGSRMLTINIVNGYNQRNDNRKIAQVTLKSSILKLKLHLFVLKPLKD